MSKELATIVALVTRLTFFGIVVVFELVVGGLNVAMVALLELVHILQRFMLCFVGPHGCNLNKTKEMDDTKRTQEIENKRRR